MSLTAAGDQALAQLGDGSTWTDLRNLEWWAAVLPPSEFMRVHRSTLIRIDRVSESRRRVSSGWEVHIDSALRPAAVSRAAVPLLRCRLGL